VKQLKFVERGEALHAYKELKDKQAKLIMHEKQIK
jgi:hypothetical protein